MCCSKRQNKQPVGHFIFATLILDSLKEKKIGNLRKRFYFQENGFFFSFFFLLASYSSQAVGSGAFPSPGVSESLPRAPLPLGPETPHTPGQRCEPHTSFSLQRAIHSGSATGFFPGRFAFPTPDRALGF